MYRAGVVLAALFLGWTVPGQLQAQDVERITEEIRAAVQSDYDYVRENLEDKPDTFSKKGSVEFWSSGGLINVVPPDVALRSYDSFSLTPKHIHVIAITDDVAVAQFYVEGSYQEVGLPPVNHYLTRATQVFVREDGEWKIRAAHWSPVTGGSGTHQTAIVM